MSQEALELIENESVRGDQIAGSPALKSRDVSNAIGSLSANSLAKDPQLSLLSELDPKLPPVPFRSIREGADFSQPAQEGTGNEG